MQSIANICHLKFRIGLIWLDWIGFDWKYKSCVMFPVLFLKGHGTIRILVRIFLCAISDLQCLFAIIQ